MLRRKVLVGHLDKKVGMGWYEYDGAGNKIDPADGRESPPSVTGLCHQPAGRTRIQTAELRASDVGSVLLAGDDRPCYQVGFRGASWPLRCPTEDALETEFVHARSSTL